MSGGLKYDDGKARWELLPFDALDDVAKVLTYGAKKYTVYRPCDCSLIESLGMEHGSDCSSHEVIEPGEHNWAKGMKWSRLLGAAMRHLTAWALGERLDPESGLPHLAHAACCVLFISASERRGIGEDDRGLSCLQENHGLQKRKTS